MLSGEINSIIASLKHAEIRQTLHPTRKQTQVCLLGYQKMCI